MSFNNIPVEYAIGVYPFSAADPSEISFQKDDVMIILKKLPDGWLQVDFSGKLGYAPSNHVRITRTAPESRSRRQLSRYSLQTTCLTIRLKLFT